MKRRDFLRKTGLGAGALAAGGAGGLVAGCAPGSAAAGAGPGPVLAGAPAVHTAGSGPDVVVVGAGAFGGWTALNLQEMGARVTLVF
jgi:NADPH-dependent 2,4-dienoyl-CoA reductase/sulfur reductase-like enzyme